MFLAETTCGVLIKPMSGYAQLLAPSVIAVIHDLCDLPFSFPGRGQVIVPCCHFCSGLTMLRCPGFVLF